jgi:hypothetical protein
MWWLELRLRQCPRAERDRHSGSDPRSVQGRVAFHLGVTGTTGAAALGGVTTASSSARRAVPMSGSRRLRSRSRHRRSRRRSEGGVSGEARSNPDLQRNVTLEAHVARAIHLTHTSGPDGSNNFVRTELGAGFNHGEMIPSLTVIERRRTTNHEPLTTNHQPRPRASRRPTASCVP